MRSLIVRAKKMAPYGLVFAAAALGYMFYGGRFFPAGYKVLSGKDISGIVAPIAYADAPETGPSGDSSDSGDSGGDSGGGGEGGGGDGSGDCGDAGGDGCGDS